MRVLHAIDSLATGGAERSLVAVAPYLARHGVELHIVPIAPPLDLATELEDAPVHVHPPIARSTRRARISEARAVIRSLRPDLVHTSLYEATIAFTSPSFVERVPSLVSVVSEEFGAAHYATPTMRRSRVFAAHATAIANARLVTHFHAVSRSVERTMARRLLISKRRITVIPRGRDPRALGERSEDRRANVRARLGLSDHNAVVLCVARHDHAKGLDLAVAALQLLEHDQPVTLLIAGGSGNLTASLERQATGRLGPGRRHRLQLLGVRSDVPDLLAAADVFCFPSRREGSPGALLEAMALEVPIVATDIPPIREVIGAHPGLVGDPTPQALAGAVARALRRPPTAAARRLRQRFLDRYTLESSAVALSALYRELSGDG